MIQDILIPLFSLITLEIILGVDNIIFISIIANRLPENQRDKLRYWGIGLAIVLRLFLLAFISWILKLDQTLFTIINKDISGKGLILVAGGLFLIYKSTKEIYHKTEITISVKPKATKTVAFRQLLLEVLILDLVFSIDSIITAVGMVTQLWIMYVAVIVAVIIMFIASKPIHNFINKHPSFKILALCFLMMIGVALLAEGLHFEIPKGYIYFSMAFAFLVDVIQMKTVKKSLKKIKTNGIRKMESNNFYNKKIGILGGGQLGKMLCNSAANWHLETLVLDTLLNCSASLVCNHVHAGNYNDYETVYRFGQ